MVPLRVQGPRIDDEGGDRTGGVEVSWAFGAGRRNATMGQDAIMSPDRTAPLLAFAHRQERRPQRHVAASRTLALYLFRGVSASTV